MAMLHPVRKACPGCGKPMKAVSEEASERPPRYVCTSCEDDPLRDPAARKWVDGRCGLRSGRRSSCARS